MIRIRESASGVKVGSRYGKWTVIGKPFADGKPPKLANWLVVAKCDCGRVAVLFCGNLAAGKSSVCQTCHTMRINLKHGGARYARGAKQEPLHKIWKGMRQRCLNPKCPAYKNYGGKGVLICAEWHDYANFRKWALARGYRPGLTIDRKNNDGNYEPANCQWLTKSANSAKQAIDKRKKRGRPCSDPPPSHLSCSALPDKPVQIANTFSLTAPLWSSRR